MLIDMKVSALTVDPFTDMPIVILEDEGDDNGRARRVPIAIGLCEASAIATELEGIHLDRPTTHDLMRNLLSALGVHVDCVEVYDLKKNTFYATIHLVREDGRRLCLDARPSDALALALRTGAAIRVAEEVLEKAREIDVSFDPQAAADASSEADDLATATELTALRGEAELYRELLEGLSASAFGKWKM